MDCCVIQVQKKQYPVPVTDALKNKRRITEKLALMRKTCLLRIIQIQVILDAFSSQGNTLIAFTNVMKELTTVQENLDNDQARIVNIHYTKTVLQKIEMLENEQISKRQADVIRVQFDEKITERERLY